MSERQQALSVSDEKSKVESTSADVFHIMDPLSKNE